MPGTITSDQWPQQPDGICRGWGGNLRLVRGIIPTPTSHEPYDSGAMEMFNNESGILVSFVLRQCNEQLKLNDLGSSAELGLQIEAFKRRESMKNSDVSKWFSAAETI